MASPSRGEGLLSGKIPCDFCVFYAIDYMSVGFNHQVNL